MVKVILVTNFFLSSLIFFSKPGSYFLVFFQNFKAGASPLKLIEGVGLFWGLQGTEVSLSGSSL